MKRMKSLLSLVLTASLLVGILAPAASAASFSIDTIIDYQYEDAKSFSDDLAAVKKNGKWGYIDEDNNMVISPAYDFAGDFSEGVAVVGKQAEEGQMDPFGEVYPYYYDLYLLKENGAEIPLSYFDVGFGETLPLTYASYEDDIESASALWFSQCGVINIDRHPIDSSTGQEIQPDSAALPATSDWGWDYYQMNGVCVDGVISMSANQMAMDSDYLCFFMDKTGKVTRTFDIVSFPWEDTGAPLSATFVVYPPNQDRMVASYNTYEYNEDWGGWEWMDTKFGALDMKGNWAVQPIYDGYRYFLSGKYFSDGLWIVKNEDGKYGAVDKNGKVVIPLEYDFLGSSSEGMVSARKDGQYGYVDAYNKTFSIATIDNSGVAQIDAASHFNGGVAPVYSESAGMAYCIQNIAVNGVLQAIPGTEGLEMSVYFPEYVSGSSDLGTITTVGDTMVVQKDGKYGFAKMEFSLDLPDQSAMDTWAYDEVCKAIEAGLVPNELQNQYRSPITRADFALLLTEVATTITGKDLETLVHDVTGKTLDQVEAAQPFTDARDDAILAANALGIINGVGNGLFKPYNTITRQDAATMLLRAATAIKADAMEGWGDKLAQANVAFSDGAAFAPYAQEAIQVMAALDVMKGVGNNTFSPKGTYTRQQSFMTAYRLMTQILDEAGQR